MKGKEQMKIIRLWCDEQQIEKVKALPTCSRVKKSKAPVSGGRQVNVYVVLGGDSILADIDTILG